MLEKLWKYNRICGRLNEDNRINHKTSCLRVGLNEENKFVNHYDCQIIAESFYPLLQSESWKIEYKNYENYRKRANQDSVCVSALGYENTGKSFMVSKVMGKVFPQGKHVKTTGLCIVYPDDDNVPWTALDTPGTNVSIKLESLKVQLKSYFGRKNVTQDDIQRMLYGDNILIESLLQEFVVSHTQVLLIIVGKLRRDDQRFINGIKFQKDLADKRIIIVHNLLETRDLEDVEKIIKEDIIETFGTQKRIVEFSSGQRHCVYLEEGSPKIEHVVMAHEGSEAGDYYNENTINYIKQVIKTFPYCEKLDLVDAFYKYLNSQYKTFLSSTKESNNPFVIKDTSEIATAISLQGHENYSIKYNLSDEFGHLKIISPGPLVTVPYSVKVYFKDCTPYLQFELEVSGRCHDSSIKFKLVIQGNRMIMHIKGKIEDNIVREDGGKPIENTRKFGDFILSSEPFDLGRFTINKTEHPTFCNRISGLKIIRFNLYEIVLNDDF